jgi:hypothetical protein
LGAFSDRTASPKELSDEFGENLARLSYHVKVLADAGAIELIRTAKRRGATEHFYRRTMRPMLNEADWSKLPPAARDAIGIQTFNFISEHVAEAAERGAFEDPQVHVSWTRLELDAEAHAPLVDELEAVVHRALELQGESANRVADSESEAPTISSELAILHFRRPEPEDE